jgi:hypothetical protein
MTRNVCVLCGLSAIFESQRLPEIAVKVAPCPTKPTCTQFSGHEVGEIDFDVSLRTIAVPDIGVPTTTLVALSRI